MTVKKSGARWILLTTAALPLLALPLPGCAGGAGSGASAGNGAGSGEQAAAVAPAPGLPAGVTLVSAGVPGDPMAVSTYKLSNGMTVMLSVNRESPRIDAWITTRAGSAKDPADATGMAHYLEHMQFKGTDRLGTLNWEAEKAHLDRISELYDELHRTSDQAKRDALYAEIDAENQKASPNAVPNELDRLYDGLGAQGLNAFTSNDQTSYTVNIPSNRVEQWAEIEAERLRKPVYRLFQSEIEAVYEEKNRGMDNRARVTFEAMFFGLFPKHPYGTQPTLGTVEHLKNPRISKMYEFFNTWYQPQNMMIALSGDFDPASTLATLERTLGKLPTKAVPADPKFEIAKPEGVRRVETKFKGEEEVVLAFLTVPEGHADQDALVLCDMMLANGSTGLIDVNLNQAQRCRRAGSSPQFLVDAGFQTFTGSPKQGQTLEELEGLLLAEIANLKAGKFTEEDMAAVITEFELQKKRELESNRARVTAMTESFINQTPWEHSVHRIERLRKISKAQIIAAANQYFGNDYVCVTRRDAEPELPKIPKPKFTPVKIDPSKRTDWYQDMVGRQVSPIEPRFLEKGRDYFETPLRTGTLVYGKNPLNDVFDLSFTVQWGTDNDPRLGTAFGLLDLGGAGPLDGVALKRKLYALGSSISAGSSRDETTISVSGLEANLEATVDLLRQHFQAPTGVGDEDLKKLVSRSISARRDAKRSPAGIGAALGEFAVRGKESGFLTAPTDEQMSAWTADELLAATRRVWDFKRTVRYVGQRPMAEVAAIVDLGPIGGKPEQIGEAPARKPVVPAIPAKNRVLFVNQKSAQAQVGIVAADGPFKREDVPVQRVYNEMMSGSMGSIVFQEIRESRSLAYAAGTGYRAAGWKDETNLMTGSVGTQANKTVDAVTVLMDIVRKMPANESRFNQAKTAIDQVYRTGRIDFRTVPSAYIGWTRQGMDGDPRPYNWDHIKSMTLADVEKFAARFADMPFTITIVGPADQIDVAKLAAFGEVVEMTPDQLFSW